MSGATVFICGISHRHLIITASLHNYSQQNTVKLPTSTRRRNPVPEFIVPIFVLLGRNLNLDETSKVIQNLSYIHVIVVRKSKSVLLFFQPAMWVKVVDLFLNSKDINTNIKAASDRSQIHLAPASIASSTRKRWFSFFKSCARSRCILFWFWSSAWVGF